MKIKAVFIEKFKWNDDLEKIMNRKDCIDCIEMDDGSYKFIFNSEWTFPFKPTIGERVVFLDKVREIKEIQYNIDRDYCVLFLK